MLWCHHASWRAGGASFVWLDGGSEPLVVAGGGAGADAPTAGAGTQSAMSQAGATSEDYRRHAQPSRSTYFPDTVRGRR